MSLMLLLQPPADEAIFTLLFLEMQQHQQQKIQLYSQDEITSIHACMQPLIYACMHINASAKNTKPPLCIIASKKENQPRIQAEPEKLGEEKKKTHAGLKGRNLGPTAARIIVLV